MRVLCVTVKPLNSQEQGTKAYDDRIMGQCSVYHIAGVLKGGKKMSRMIKDRYFLLLIISATNDDNTSNQVVCQRECIVTFLILFLECQP